ncbi:PH domain-containing protein [Dactylosporangium aurantiacum]|uniref:PH domain-containing protein n=1 Tax=Dactylosporangium aurantiacum TaxID=35754 RepID=A0A9Q9IIM1_9ACTN|nr:PH domain-containing protein [Dactylosporangium aurantiacum]MDG6101120.1 PH domain-containing protein [Dactylosporangium aurantiacum]UWZ54845.1 PH domain-containing protein [Dactylosporangium aurantiacum]
MDIRSGAFSASTPPPAGTDLRWRVSTGFAALKACAAIALLLAGVFVAGDRRALAAALIAAAILGVYALRDFIAPVRLAADLEGLTVVSGYASRRRLDWAQVERMRVDARSRGGMRSELLEIDAGEHLFLLSRYDLNAHPADVHEELLRLRGFSSRA